MGKKREIEGRVNGLLVVGLLLIAVAIILILFNFSLVVNYFQVGEEKAGEGELYTAPSEEEERVMAMAGEDEFIFTFWNSYISSSIKLLR